jgi:flagella synthesis protein FlgN
MTATTLLSLFDEDIGNASQLLELIDSELEALNTNDLPRLQTLLNQKQPLLALLAQHATQRSQLLAAEQFSPDREGLMAFAARSEARGESGSLLLEKSARLTSLIEQCQTANLRNGRLIKASQVSTGQMVKILRGSDTPTLYDSRGTAAKIGHQRPISQA